MDGNRARNDASAQGGVVGNGGGGSQGASSSTSAAAAASAAGAGAGAVEGLPFYEKERQRLKELIAKKRAIDRRLQGEEERIYRLETEYLESTPSGNIIIGFDNYTKGAPSNSATAAAARRKGGGGGGGGSSSQFDPQGINSNRVFSRSSVSYNGKGGNGADGSDGVQTPGGASTPGGGIGEEMAHTPGSGRNAGGGGPNGKKVVIKKRESSTAADVDDGGEREAKKVRVSFGGGGGGANGTPGAGRK